MNINSKFNQILCQKHELKNRLSKLSENYRRIIERKCVSVYKKIKEKSLSENNRQIIVRKCESDMKINGEIIRNQEAVVPMTHKKKRKGLLLYAMAQMKGF